MDQIEMSKIHANLTIRLQDYIKMIIKKYGEYISDGKLNKLNSIKDFGEFIKIYDYGSVNAYASHNGIGMPLCADRLLKMASKIPGYGINKGHKSYNSENLINNNNTFVDYIFHVFVSGTNAEGYYEDMLLHEAMHFCGSGGATALKEGINELLTRKLALEEGIRTNGCGYPKEVQIAYQLQNVFGEEILDQIAFINSEKQIYLFLVNSMGFEAAELYINVSQMMEKEFSEKYFSDIDSYNGISGIVRKTLNYKKIDYSEVYKMLNDYSSSLQESMNKGTKK